MFRLWLKMKVRVLYFIFMGSNTLIVDYVHFLKLYAHCTRPLQSSTIVVWETRDEDDSDKLLSKVFGDFRKQRYKINLKILHFKNGGVWEFALECDCFQSPQNDPT